MLPGIPLFFRRGKELVLCVIVDHGLGQDLVIIMTFGGSEIIFHKGRDLIHVKIDIGGLMAEGATFIASGIIDSRKDEVITGLEKAGLSVVEVKEKRGWECIVCKKA